MTQDNHKIVRFKQSDILTDKELEQIDMPELWIVSPALLRGKEDEVKDNLLLKDFDPFALVEMACANKFTLRFIPTSDVCLLRPKA